MTKEEKEILKKVIEHPKGLLPPVDYINVICKRNQKIAQKLVSLGYIEEVPITIQTGEQINFYRITPKGYSVFYPIHKKIWYWFKGDIRTIIVAIVTSVITTIISLVLARLFK